MIAQQDAKCDQRPELRKGLPQSVRRTVEDIREASDVNYQDIVRINVSQRSEAQTTPSLSSSSTSCKLLAVTKRVPWRRSGWDVGASTPENFTPL